VFFIQVSSIERGLVSLLHLRHVNLVRYLGFSYTLQPACLQISVRLLFYHFSITALQNRVVYIYKILLITVYVSLIAIILLSFIGLLVLTVLVE